MNQAARTLKALVLFVWLLTLAALSLPVQAGQDFSGPEMINYSVSTYGVSIMEPFQSGMAVDHTVTLPLTIQNTGSDPDQYGVVCSIESGGVGWSAGLLDSDGLILDADCTAGTYYTLTVAGGDSLALQVQMEAPPAAPIGDYLRVSVTATSGSDAQKHSTVVRQGAVSAPFIQNFSDNQTGRRLQVSNPKYFFTRVIGPQIEWPGTLAVTYLDEYRYINAWGYGLGTHVNIEYEVMNILSNYPPSVVQLTDNPDRTIDHSTAMSAAANGITGVAFIRTIYDTQDPPHQKLNVFFARIDARGLPLGTPVNVTNNPYFGLSNSVDVPFFSEVSIRATTNNRFILTWVKTENDLKDLYEAVFDSVSGAQIGSNVQLTAATASLGYANPGMAGLNTSVQTFLTYVSEETAGPTTLWGVKLDNNGAKVGADFSLGTINSTDVDVAQLSGGNLLTAWIDDVSKNPTFYIWDTGGNLVAGPTTLDLPDGLPASQIAVTYDQYGHGIITWGNLIYSRLYYALVDGSGSLITPPMIQRSAENGIYIELGASTHSTAFLKDPIAWLQFMPIARLKNDLTENLFMPMVGK